MKRSLSLSSFSKGGSGLKQTASKITPYARKASHGGFPGHEGGDGLSEESFIEGVAPYVKKWEEAR